MMVSNIVQTPYYDHGYKLEIRVFLCLITVFLILFILKNELFIIKNTASYQKVSVHSMDDV